MMPYEITSTNTSNNEIDLRDFDVLSDYGNDTVFCAFVKILSGTFYFATGESATGSSKAFTTAENPVPPIPCSKEYPLNYRTAASGASAVITFCP
jgi:hypothetical protein